MSHFPPLFCFLVNLGTKIWIFVSLLFCCVLCKSLILSYRFVHRSRSESKIKKKKKRQKEQKSKHRSQFQGTEPIPEGIKKSKVFQSVLTECFLLMLNRKKKMAIRAVRTSRHSRPRSPLWITNAGKKLKWNNSWFSFFVSLLLRLIFVHGSEERGHERDRETARERERAIERPLLTGVRRRDRS